MALATLDLRGHTGPLAEALPGPPDVGADVTEAVSRILARVRLEGDVALRSLTAELDGVDIDALRVDEGEVAAAIDRIPAELRDALELAHRRIVAYHAEAPPGPRVFRSDGVTVRDLPRPVRRAGCYAPGGRARYPSTVLMCAAAARVAGVAEVILCTPPGPAGTIDDVTLAAASVAGVDEVYRIGGAQAVGAMAFGTESVRAVDVVCGPGNLYVAEAQRQVCGVVGVGSAFAGPSEVVVVAGPDTPSHLAAIDLVVQAEHGPAGLAWLITWSEDTAAAVDREVERLVDRSPRRAELEATLRTGGRICLVEDPVQAVAVANAVAPEHLQLMWEGAEEVLPLVQSAGAVFVGYLAPASMGDYVAGPNHVLPTARAARFASALRTDDFVRRMHVVSVERAALEALGPAVITLATAEGLPAHADSIRLRL
jgi:histidinol dehydrogenase